MFLDKFDTLRIINPFNLLVILKIYATSLVLDKLEPRIVKFIFGFFPSNVRNTVLHGLTLDVGLWFPGHWVELDPRLLAVCGPE